jgi:hypothetical protein
MGGCIGGAGCLTHGEINKIHVDKHSKKSSFTEITAAVDAMKK